MVHLGESYSSAGTTLVCRENKFLASHAQSSCLRSLENSLDIPDDYLTVFVGRGKDVSLDYWEAHLRNLGSFRLGSIARENNFADANLLLNLLYIQSILQRRSFRIKQIPNNEITLGIASCQHGVICVERHSPSAQKRFPVYFFDHFGNHIYDDQMAAKFPLKAALRSRECNFGTVGTRKCRCQDSGRGLNVGSLIAILTQAGVLLRNNDAVASSSQNQILVLAFKSHTKNLI